MERTLFMHLVRDFMDGASCLPYLPHAGIPWARQDLEHTAVHDTG